MLNVSGHPTALYGAFAARLEDELRSRYCRGQYFPSEKKLALGSCEVACSHVDFFTLIRGDNE